MNNTLSRILSIVVYLIPILGPLAVLVIQRDDTVAHHHAQQALSLNLAVIGLTASWFLVAWVVSWIPLAGPLIAASLFALVILGYLVGVGLWIFGLTKAIQGEPVVLPLISILTRRLFPSAAAA